VIFVALDEAAAKGELLLVEGGMCRFHYRRDGVVVVREILVLPEFRGRGIGRELLCRVRQRRPGCDLLAKCPTSYVSNGFWAKMGFTLETTEKDVNTWRLASA
jgi:GNAT superfamily N-acetyltransferase